MTDKKDEALKLALEKVQEFKARWWKVPPFGNKVNKATREAITNAHSPIFELENTIREALAEQTAQEDPCPGCRKGVVCRTPKCGRLKLPVDHPFRSEQQEPVAWRLWDEDPLGGMDHRWVYYDKSDFVDGVDPAKHFKVEPLYTPPPARKPLTDGLEIKVKRELFRFHSEQDWVNKAQSRYANCGVRKGYYITVDAAGHVMHVGLCFKNAAYPVTCYELQTNWREESSAHGIKEQP